MKIAALISGESRFYKNSIISIKHLLKDFDVDYFCHSWNYNTSNVRLNIKDGNQYIERGYRKTHLTPNQIIDFHRYIKEYLNTNVLIETEHDYNNYIRNKHRIPWGPMWYSFMKSFELLNNKHDIFQYDMIIKLRFDIAFDITSHIVKPKYNTLYAPFIMPITHLPLIYGEPFISDVTFYGLPELMFNLSKFIDYEIDLLKSIDYEFCYEPGNRLWAYTYNNNIFVDCHTHLNPIIIRHGMDHLDTITDIDQILSISSIFYI